LRLVLQSPFEAHRLIFLPSVSLPPESHDFVHQQVHLLLVRIFVDLRAQVGELFVVIHAGGL
jgi:hypothetical protein